VQVKTKNLIVGALVVLLVGMLWYRVVYSPIQSKASKAKTAAHDADAQSANLRAALKGSTAPKKNAKSTSTKALLAAVPADPAEAEFLRDLDVIRIDTGAQWQSVTPGLPAPAVGGGTSVSVGITVSGTEDQIARYLVELTSMDRVFVIDNVSMSQGGSTSPAGTADATAHGAVFLGAQQQATISGRIFSASTGVASTATGTGGASTTPATGAPAPTGAGAPTGTVNG
jgi:Tfp pilus assembly protein PilO